MTFHVNHDDAAGPEAIDWEPILLTPLPWAHRIKGLIAALTFSFFAVLIWGAAIIQISQWIRAW